MDQHEEKFNILKNPPRRGMMFKYANSLVGGNKLCFVEGYTDEIFYSRSSIAILKNECTYILHENDDEDQGYVGKAAVIQAYLDINGDSTLSNHLGRTIFLIDRDYDNEVIHNGNILESDDQKRFTITPYHSFENFFIIPKNLEKLFDMLSLDSSDVTDFTKILEKFALEFADFCALRGAITACFKYGWEKPKYIRGKKYEFDSLRFNNKNSYYLDWKYFDIETENMRRSIINIERAEDYYYKLYSKLRRNYLYVNGHIAYDFLKSYLRDVHEIGFPVNCEEMKQNKLYHRCIHCLEIPLRVVSGTGKRLHPPFK